MNSLPELILFFWSVREKKSGDVYAKPTLLPFGGVCDAHLISAPIAQHNGINFPSVKRSELDSKALCTTAVLFHS